MPTSDRPNREIIIAIYFVAAAVLICGCIIFIVRHRSRD
jgi:hypothetical protein